MSGPIAWFRRLQAERRELDEAVAEYRAKRARATYRAMQLHRELDPHAPPLHSTDQMFDWMLERLSERDREKERS